VARDHYEQLTHHAIAVSTSAVKLTSQRTPANRNAALIQNVGTDILYIGGATVTTATGIRVAANEHIVIEGPVEVFGISVGSSDVRVIEFE
jgi:hypothetical protein